MGISAKILPMHGAAILESLLYQTLEALELEKQKEKYRDSETLGRETSSASESGENCDQNDLSSVPSG